MYTLRFPFEEHLDQNLGAVRDFNQKLEECFTAAERASEDLSSYSFERGVAALNVATQYIQQLLLPELNLRSISVWGSADYSYFKDEFQNAKDGALILLTNGPTTALYSLIDENLRMEVFEQSMSTPTKQYWIRHDKERKTMAVYCTDKISALDFLKIKVIHWQLASDNNLPESINELIACLNGDKKETELLGGLINHDLVKEKIEEALNRIFTYNSGVSIASLEHEIHNTYTSIHEKENRICRILYQIRHLEDNIKTKLAEIETIRNRSDKLDPDRKALLSYLRKHPYIINISNRYGNDQLTIEYLAPIRYYSKETIKVIQFRRTGTKKHILQAFIDDEYELMTRATVHFSTTDYSTDSSEYISSDGYIAHPHLGFYGCFGNHRRGIADAAKMGNDFGIIEQITQMVLNLNFDDGCVVNKMLDMLAGNCSNLKTWRNRKTNELISTYELVRIMREREENNEETTPQF